MEKKSEIVNNEEEYKAIGQRIKELRKTQYSSYEDISYEIGMSRSSYWGFENGKNFEIKTLIRFCRLLNISLEEFFSGINLPAKK